MVEKLSNYIVNELLYKDEEVEENQKDIMIFGVTRILEDIPKFAIIFFMCYLLNFLKELGLVFLITILYKTFIGGAHARTNLSCFLITSVYFILPIILAKYLDYSVTILYTLYAIILIFSVFIILKIAPADTEEIPIINKKRRRELKIGGFISLSIISILTILFVDNIVYMRIIVYTIFLVDIFATPILYKLLKCKLGSESEEYSKLYQ